MARQQQDSEELFFSNRGDQDQDGGHMGKRESGGDHNSSRPVANEEFLRESQKIQDTLSFLMIKASHSMDKMHYSTKDRYNSFLWEMSVGILARGKFNSSLDEQTLEQVQSLIMFAMGIGIQSGKTNYLNKEYKASKKWPK